MLSNKLSSAAVAVELFSININNILKLMKIFEKKEQKKYFAYYQTVLAVIVIGYFFTGFDVYSTVFKPWTSIPVSTFFIQLFSFAALTLIAQGQARFLPPFLVLWCLLYMLISLIGSSPESFVTKDGITAEFPLRLLSVTVILSMVTILTRYKEVQKWARWTIFIAVIIAMFNNVNELIHPEIFDEAITDPALLEIANLSGRPAGIYLDPNRCGGALILGMIFSIGMLPISVRFIYLLVIGFGVFITFSRGAIIAWVVIAFVLFLRGIVNVKMTKSSLAYFAVPLLLVLFLSANNLLNFEIHANNQDRLEDFLGGSTGEDSGRGGLAEIAWHKFLDNPISGSGTGAHLSVGGESTGRGAHNSYLKYMVENGFIGGLFMPSVVFIAAWGAKGEAKDIAIPFICFMLIWGFFSHNVLEERHILISISLMAAIKEMESRKVSTESKINILSS
jgi:O-Antigen ligase